VRVAYFVHDLADAAVARRVRMLRASGAEVVVIGFHRGSPPPGGVAGVETIDLGKTFDAHLVHRAAAVAGQVLAQARWVSGLARADVVLARNLEMLALGAIARKRLGARLVYECLDIHRLMLSAGGAGSCLRALERRLLKRTDALIVSSNQFVDRYFGPVHGVDGSRGPRVAVVENKVFPSGALSRRSARDTAEPKWIIGWYGAIRCRRSLQLFSRALSERHDFEVVIRGRPSLTEFDDFHRQVRQTPGISDFGPYDPEDVGRLYHEAHFAWAVDYFDAGGNSEWLLPNRLYESALGGAVPIARAHTASGDWLRRHRIGAVLDDPEEDLVSFLDGLTPDRYARLQKAVLDAPLDHFVAGPADCNHLRRVLEGAAA
jgi:succinoglycan biosynthesis protein ExoL